MALMEMSISQILLAHLTTNVTHEQGDGAPEKQVAGEAEMDLVGVILIGANDVDGDSEMHTVQMPILW